MKTAEVNVNVKLTVKVNDLEKRAFMEACKDRGENPSFIIRRFMRRYTKEVIDMGDKKPKRGPKKKNPAEKGPVREPIADPERKKKPKK